MTRFILNQQTIESSLPPGGTLLDFIRETKRLSGTKIGCREGDCGACTVLVGDRENGALVYRSATSCLMPLGNAHGKHIVTVEGINMGNSLSPVQRALVDEHGSQCGFCTIGFVMSLTGFAMDATRKEYRQAIEAMDGNICRCTGYKSIERAAEVLVGELAEKPTASTVAWLVENEFLPSYFLGIEKRLTELKQLENHIDTPNHVVMGGGTDLMVQRPEAIKKSVVKFVSGQDPLKGISMQNGTCELGGATTVTEFAESSIIQGTFPDLKRYMKWVSSTPIRNMATLAGNIVNASPIGDMTIFFLALDADLVLIKDGQRRTVKLRQFYQGYKQLGKHPDELVEKIRFIPPKQGAYFNFEKVCKREHLDIASVNTACQLVMSPNGAIESILLSAGGIGPIPTFLAKTCTYFIGKQITQHTLSEAFDVMNTEISPISDARGTMAYKRLLLRQLILAHFLHFFGQIDAVKEVISNGKNRQ